MFVPGWHLLISPATCLGFMGPCGRLQMRNAFANSTSIYEQSVQAFGIDADADTRAFLSIDQKDWSSHFTVNSIADVMSAVKVRGTICLRVITWALRRPQPPKLAL